VLGFSVGQPLLASALGGASIGLLASPLTTPRSTPIPALGQQLQSQQASLGGAAGGQQQQLSLSSSAHHQSLSRSSLFDDTSSPDMTAIHALLNTASDG